MLSLFGIFYEEHAVWLLPVFIFFARILDVSIGTLRIVFLGRGMRLLAPLCGFFEVLIWLIAVSRIMGDLTSWFNYIAYAGGFAAGNYVGMYIEHRLAIGLLSVMIITPSDAETLLQKFAKANFGVTQVAAQGGQGKVSMVYLIIKRKDLSWVLEMLKTDQPDAFVVVNDVRTAAGGIFPLETVRPKTVQKWFRGMRPGK